MENAAFPGEQTLHAAEAWENPALPRRRATTSLRQLILGKAAGCHKRKDKL